MNWFKTKKDTEAVSFETDPLLSLVRTMEDDQAGRTFPNKVALKPEPMAAFNPDTAAEGAPFYAAPGVIAPPDQSKAAEISPFLQETIQAETAADPAISQTQSPLPSAFETVVADMSVAPQKTMDQTAIPFTTPPDSKATPFQGALPEVSALKTVFHRILQDKRLRLFAFGGFLVALILVGGSIWWLFSGKETDGVNDLASPSANPTPVIEEPRSEPVTPPKYQATQPNILSFDTETVTPEQIKTTLLQAGQSIQKDALPGAIEFLIRDQKLNPLALSRFAYLAKLDLPAELLTTLDEAFSLYIFIDDARPRAVLSTSIKDETVFLAELKKSEKSIGTALDPLYLDMTTAPKSNLIFQDGSYLERPVRFANIDATLGLSVDYAVRGRQWIVGTSKDALRSVLDKNGL